MVEHPLSKRRLDSCSLDCPGIPVAYVEGVFDRDVLLCGPHVATWKNQFGDIAEVKYFRHERGTGKPVKK